MADEPASPFSSANPTCPASVDLYFSFRSPYSYLATPGALQLAQDYALQLNLRPVLPLAVREPGFFSPDNLKRARYIGMDWLRRAQMLGMAHRWPSPDPIVQDMQTYRIADEQPHIHRLTHLGVQAQRRGRGPAFAYEVSHLLFGGTRDWHQGEHLAQAAQRAGLDLSAMEQALSDQPGSHAAEVDANQAALTAAGHWGVPTFVFNGEPFFGEDRIATLRWRLDQQAGLRRNAASA